MNGGQRLRRAPEPDVIRPVTPVRIERNEDVLREVTLHLYRIREQIHGLQSFAATVPVESQIPEQLARSRQTLRNLALDSVPLLGNLYQDNVHHIEELLDRAQHAFESNNVHLAGQLVHASQAQMANIGEVLSLQTDLLKNCAPSGSNSGVLIDALTNSLDSVLNDAGTPNERRFVTVLAATRHYTIHHEVYNSQDPAAISSRNGLFGLIIQRGNEARAGTTYSGDNDAADNAMLVRFESNISTLENTFRNTLVSTVSGWSAHLGQLAMIDLSNSPVREMIDSLRRESDQLLTRLRGPLSPEIINEVLEFGQRYYVQTHSEESQSVLLEFDSLTNNAIALRGNAVSPAVGTAAWFGSFAIDALDHGERARAALAVAFGNLATMARNLPPSRLEALFPRDRQQFAMGVIVGSIATSEDQIRSLVGQIRSTSLVLNSEHVSQTARNITHSVPREIATRLNSILAAIRTRANDEESLRRLLRMASSYLEILSHNQRANVSVLSSAIDRELAGTNSETEFNLGLNNYRLSLDINSLRQNSNSWGAGISRQIQVFGSILDRAQRAINEGDFTNARMFISLASMYQQTIELFAIRRQGRIASIDLRFNDSQMVASISSLLASPSQSGLAAFTNQFNQSRTLFVQIEVERLTQLSASRTFGHDTITRALNAATARATSGDIGGALLLLTHVIEFYGAARVANQRTHTVAQNEGWRYSQYSADNSPMRPVGQRLLDALTLEIGATTPNQHTSAAIASVRARYQSDSRSLMLAEATRLSGVLANAPPSSNSIPFIAGEESTRGRIPIGRLPNGGAYSAFIDVATIRRYELDHANTDPALTGGQSIDVLLASVTAAANSGNINLFNTSRAALLRRVELVTNRTLQAQNIASLVAGVQQSIDALASSRDALTATRQIPNPALAAARYGSMAPPRRGSLPSATISVPVYSEISDPNSAISQRVSLLNRNISELAALQRQFEQLATTSTPISAELLDRYTRLVGQTEQSVRIVNSYLFIQNQISSNDQYIHSLDPNNARAEDRSAVLRELTASSVSLRAAANTVLEGGFNAAREEYRTALAHRVAALTLQSASTHTVSRDTSQLVASYLAVGGVQRRPSGQSVEFDQYRPYFEASNNLFINLTAMPSERIRIQQRRDQITTTTLVPTREGQTQVVSQTASTTLVGSSLVATTPAEISGLQRNLSQIDASVFCVSPRSDANALGVMGTLADYQRRIRDVIYTNQTGASEAAASQFTAMQEVARRNQQVITYANLALTGVMLIGTGGTLAGVGGAVWLTRGAMALQMGYQFYSEIEHHGAVSPNTWAMFGFIAATEGISGLSTYFRTMANVSRPLSELSEAEMSYLRLSRGLAYTNTALGAGFSAYMVPGIYTQFSEGHYAEGLMNAAMLLGGLAGSAVGYRQLRIDGRRLAEFDALASSPVAAIDAAARDISLLSPPPATVNPVSVHPDVNPYTVDGLFAILRRMTTPAGHAEVVAELDLLPQNVRDGIVHLSQDAEFMRLVASGARTAINPQLQNVVGGFVPHSQGGQIMLGRPVRTASRVEQPRFQTPSQAWEYLRNPNNTDPRLIDQAYNALPPNEVNLARQLRESTRSTSETTPTTRRTTHVFANDAEALAYLDQTPIGSRDPATVQAIRQNPERYYRANRRLLDDTDLPDISTGSRPIDLETPVGSAEAAIRRGEIPNRGSPQGATDQPQLAIDVEGNVISVGGGQRPAPRRSPLRMAGQDPNAPTTAPGTNVPTAIPPQTGTGTGPVQAVTGAVRGVGRRIVGAFGASAGEAQAVARNSNLSATEYMEKTMRGALENVVGGVGATEPDAVLNESRFFDLVSSLWRNRIARGFNPQEVVGLLEHLFASSNVRARMAAIIADPSLATTHEMRVAIEAYNQTIQNLSTRRTNRLVVGSREFNAYLDGQSPVPVGGEGAVANRPFAPSDIDLIVRSIERDSAILRAGGNGTGRNANPIDATADIFGIQIPNSQRAGLQVNTASVIPDFNPAVSLESSRSASRGLINTITTTGDLQTSIIRYLRSKVNFGGNLDEEVLSSLRASSSSDADAAAVLADPSVTNLDQFASAYRTRKNLAPTAPDSLLDFLQQVRGARGNLVDGNIVAAADGELFLADELRAISVYTQSASTQGQSAFEAGRAVRAANNPQLFRPSSQQRGPNRLWQFATFGGSREAWAAGRDIDLWTRAFVTSQLGPAAIRAILPALFDAWVIYAGYRALNRGYNRFEDYRHGSEHLGREHAFDYLAARTGIDVENIRFAATAEGETYLAGIGRTLRFFPIDPTILNQFISAQRGDVAQTPPPMLRPHSINELYDSLYARGDVYVLAPSRANEILHIGRAMASPSGLRRRSELDIINTNLPAALRGDRESIQTITAICNPHNIEVNSLLDLARASSTHRINMADIGTLLTARFRSVGAQERTRDVIIDTYLRDRNLAYDLGDPRNRSDQATSVRRQYLLANPSSFVAVWYFGSQGYVPASATGALIDILREPNGIENAIRAAYPNLSAADLSTRAARMRAAINFRDQEILNDIVQATVLPISSANGIVDQAATTEARAARVAALMAGGFQVMNPVEREHYLNRLVTLFDPVLSARGIFIDPPLGADSLLTHMDADIINLRYSAGRTSDQNVRAELTSRADRLEHLLYGESNQPGIIAQAAADPRLATALATYTLIHDESAPNRNEIFVGDYSLILDDLRNRLADLQRARQDNPQNGHDAAVASLEHARSAGWISYEILRSIDPRTTSGPDAVLFAQFIRQTTTPDGHGLIDWIVQNREHMHGVSAEPATFSERRVPFTASVSDRHTIRDGPVTLFEILRRLRADAHASVGGDNYESLRGTVSGFAADKVIIFRSEHIWFPDVAASSTIPGVTPNRATATAVEQSLQRREPRIERISGIGVQGTTQSQTLREHVTATNNSLQEELRNTIADGIGLRPLVSGSQPTNFLTNPGGSATPPPNLAINVALTNPAEIARRLGNPVGQRFLEFINATGTGSPDVLRKQAVANFINERLVAMATELARRNPTQLRGVALRHYLTSAHPSFTPQQIATEMTQIERLMSLLNNAAITVSLGPSPRNDQPIIERPVVIAYNDPQQIPPPADSGAGLALLVATILGGTAPIRRR